MVVCFNGMFVQSWSFSRGNHDKRKGKKWALGIQPRFLFMLGSAAGGACLLVAFRSSSSLLWSSFPGSLPSFTSPSPHHPLASLSPFDLDLNAQRRSRSLF
jgi:hypothetical protein